MCFGGGVGGAKDTDVAKERLCLLLDDRGVDFAVGGVLVALAGCEDKGHVGPGEDIQHLRDTGEAVLAGDVVEGDGGVNGRGGHVVDGVGPLDHVAVGDVDVGEGHFEEADQVGGAVDGPFAGAGGGRGGIGQAQGAAYEGGLADARGAQDGKGQVVHLWGGVAVGGACRGRVVGRVGRVGVLSVAMGPLSVCAVLAVGKVRGAQRALGVGGAVDVALGGLLGGRGDRVGEVVALEEAVVGNVVVGRVVAGRLVDDGLVGGEDSAAIARIGARRHGGRMGARLDAGPTSVCRAHLHRLAPRRLHRLRAARLLVAS